MSVDRLLGSFLDLVRIDSPSGEEAAVARHCRSVLEEMGFRVSADDTRSLTGSDTGNLIAELPGTVADAPLLLLCAHMDCVEPCRGIEPVVRDGVVSTAGETVLGADDKAGIAAIFEAIARVLGDGAPRGDIRVVLTVGEEWGLRGAKALAPAKVAADLCLVLDADGEPGNIVTAAPTHYTFVAEFTGTAAHAGVEPEKGRSALAMAAAAVCAMRLGRLDEHTTANAGAISGGTATNVIPAHVTLTGECRSLRRDRIEEVRLSMDAAMRAAAEERGGDVDVRWTLEYEAFQVPDDSPALRVVQAACTDAGLTPRTSSTGGGSDASVLAAHGVPTLVLACGMRSVHSAEEHIMVRNLEMTAELLRACILRMAGAQR